MKTLDEIIRIIPGYDPFIHAEAYYFDEQTALNAIRFFEKGLVHVKGKLAGQNIVLEDWQKSIVANLLGWKNKETHYRRYVESFIFVPRKNGKTTLISGLALYALFVDKEKGAEIYCAAAEREQANYLFQISKAQVLKNPTLRDNCEIYTRAITIEKKDSFYKPISADANTKHGANPHFAVIDELHAQPNRNLVDVLETGTEAREESMIVSITTSDYERVSICNEKYAYACKVRDNPKGFMPDPTFFPVIYEASKKDDWESEKVWRKANPNYGVSVIPWKFKLKYQKAKEIPAFQNTFKRLYLNIRTEQAERWIDMDEWRKCDAPLKLKDLKGKECYAGLDLSSKDDITALVLLFKDEPHSILPFFWIPEANAYKREKTHRVPYLTWKREGLLEMTPGNTIDYKYIRKKVNDLSELYDIQEIAFDPWNAQQLSNQLQDEDGFTMVEFRQGWKSMNEPCKNLQVLMKRQAIKHGGNEILEWMAGNVAVKIDESENIRIDKKKSFEKVDGIVALAMAIGRGIANIADEGGAYDDGELFVI